MTTESRSVETGRAGGGFFSRLVDSAPDIIYRFELSPKSGFTYVNSASQRVLGYAPEELCLDPDLVLAIIHRDDLRLLSERRAANRLDPATIRLLHRDGHIVWVELSITPVVDAAGKLLAIEGIARDVTGRVEAEEELRDSQARFRTIFEQAPMGVVLLDLDGHALARNPVARRLLGLNESEATARPFYDFTFPDDLTVEMVFFQELIAGQRDQYQLEKRLIRADGHTLWVRSSVSLVRGEDGSPRYAVAIVEDIHERKLATEALRESEARFRRLSETNTTAVYRLELRPQRRFSYVSPSATQILGYSPEEFYADPDIPFKAIYPGDAPSVHRMAGMDAPEINVTFRAMHKDGHLVWVAQRDLAIRDADGTVIAREGMMMDLTEQKRMEEQLLRAQRLETAGRVAGQVAHDFNNLLSPVLAFTELLRLELPPEHAGVKYCDGMLSAVRRMNEINYDLLALGRRGLSGGSPLDLHSLVRQVASEMGEQPDSLDVKIEAGQELPLVSGSEAQLSRVVANLITNAREAMHDTGCLTIALANIRVSQPFGEYNRIEAGDYVRLSVADTGCGIAPEIRPRIFDAFFTTKRTKRGSGSGLGLSVVQAIVEDHHGYLDLKTVLGEGTTFEIYLPVHVGVSAPMDTDPPLEGRDTSLVVNAYAGGSGIERHD